MMMVGLDTVGCTTSSATLLGRAELGLKVVPLKRTKYLTSGKTEIHSQGTEMKKLITEWRKYIKEEKMADLDADQAYSTKVRGVNVIINLKDTDLQATKHSKERQFRHAEKISNNAIIQAVELAIGKIIQDYANGELGNDEPFHIKMVGRGKVPALNVIAVLDMRKGPDTIKVVTVMRKDDFKTDSFGGGQQKTYTVQSR
jgi:hypothetical protein